jgi:hypothetical protein
MPKSNVEIPHDPKTHKCCSACNQVLLRSHFTNDKSKKDGKRSRCRGCQREHRKTHGDSYLAAQRKYARKPEARYAKYKRSASERGYEFKLTRDEFMKHWQKPCVHCGDTIETIGLDRIDSAKPYQADNVEPCCRKCNQMKSDWNTVDWYLHMEKIRKYSGGFVSKARKLWKYLAKMAT